MKLTLLITVDMQYFEPYVVEFTSGSSYESSALLDSTTGTGTYCTVLRV